MTTKQHNKNANVRSLLDYYWILCNKNIQFLVPNDAWKECQRKEETGEIHDIMVHGKGFAQNAGHLMTEKMLRDMTYSFKNGEFKTRNENIARHAFAAAKGVDKNARLHHDSLQLPVEKKSKIEVVDDYGDGFDTK